MNQPGLPQRLELQMDVEQAFSCLTSAASGLGKVTVADTHSGDPAIELVAVTHHRRVQLRCAVLPGSSQGSAFVEFTDEQGELGPASRVVIQALSARIAQSAEMLD